MQLDSMIENTLDSLKTVAGSSSILGEPMIIEGKVLVPISKLSIGYLTGGGEYMESGDARRYPYAGGSGGGISVTPMGLLVCVADEYKFIRFNSDDGENKWLELIESGINLVKEKKKQ